MLRSTERSRGTGPRATLKKTPPLPVGRGPVPRYAAIYRQFAGACPPRYAEKNAAPSRRARACPSPCCALPNVRGGNPLGCACGIRGPPRYGIGRVSSRLRGTGSFRSVGPLMSIEKCASPYQGPSDLNNVYSVASRPGGLSYGEASRPGGLSYREGIEI